MNRVPTFSKTNSPDNKNGQWLKHIVTLHHSPHFDLLNWQRYKKAAKNWH